MSAGRSRNSSATSGRIAHSGPPRCRRRRSASRKPPSPTRARAGTTSWPVAFAAVRMPVASPRRATNQRFATTAASVTDTAPVATPITTPHRSVNCQVSLIRSVASAPAATAATATITHRLRPNGRTWPPRRPAEPVEHQVEPGREADRGCCPAEVVVQRDDEHPDHRPEPGHGRERHERDGEDDPAVVER